MMHLIAITIMPKDGVLDTQGRAISQTLQREIFSHQESVKADLSELRFGRYAELSFRGTKEESLKQAEIAAEKVLANQLTEKYTVRYIGEISG